MKLNPIVNEIAILDYFEFSLCEKARLILFFLKNGMRNIYITFDLIEGDLSI